MSRRTLLLFSLIACLTPIVGSIVARAPWRSKDAPPAPISETDSPDPTVQPPAPATQDRKEADTALPTPPDWQVPSTQVEAEDLKREAIRVANELIEAYPEDAVTFALLGAAHHNSGNSDEAEQWLMKCLALDPDRADAYGVLALIASKRGDFERAVEMCREALKRNPNMRDVQHRLGQALMDQGDTDELIRTMEQVVKIPPPSSESYYLLGQGYLQAGEYGKAKEWLEKVVELRPDHTQAFFGLFTACNRLQLRDEAASYGRRFQELEARDRNAATDRNVGEDTLSGLPMVQKTVSKTYTGAAQIYQSHGELYRAEELWRQAAQLDPSNTTCRAELMTLYIQQKREADARTFFEDLVQQQPESGQNQFYLGQFYERSGQAEAAAKAYRKVMQLSPERPEGYRALAELYLNTKQRLPEVESLVEQVVQRQPTAANYFLLAVACAQNENLAGARVAMGRAVELAPGNADYRRFYDRLQQEQR